MRIAVPLLFAVIACAAPLGTPTSGPRDTVTVAELGASSEAALYVGIEGGYFAQQGINVQLLPFKVATDIVPAVATGQVDVGTGTPTGARELATVLQTPADLKGKKLGIASTAGTIAQLIYERALGAYQYR